MKDTADTQAALYGMARWGDGLLTATSDGDAALCLPEMPSKAPVSLPATMHALSDRGISAPILLRVQPFLDRSLTRLHAAFAKAFKDVGYQGTYRGVFPIKVNQQSEVISRLIRVGQAHHYGLEVGSKPELMIALAQPLSPQALLICNGAKDEGFVRLALLSGKAGFNTVLVIESLREFETIRRIATQLDIRPQLGVRLKLTERVGGKWQASSGDRSAFGLGGHDLLTLVQRLKASGFIDCLMLQHTHLGSQVPDIIDIRRAAAEACRFYVELTALGAPLTHMDLGGGLGVDYTGARARDDNSVNYSVQEYCTNLAETLRHAMEAAGLDHPTIVTESGRFVVAQSSIFIFDVLDATLYDSAEKPELRDGDHHLLSDLAAVEGYIDSTRLREAFNDTIYYRDELRALFRRGQIDLEQLARTEQSFLYLASRFKAAAHIHGDLSAELGTGVDHYHGNFSLFQSLPDVWAIDQLHPIMPIQRLNEAPNRRAVFHDLTCDSDGTINRFILEGGIGDALPVHPLREGEAYHIGVFFVGAYQETLGDLHNLFGDAPIVTITLEGPDGFTIEHETEGDSIAEVLSYVEYDPGACLDAFRQTVEKAVAAGKLSPSERRMMTAAYKSSLAGHTYFHTASPIIG
ncbi:arginine decarboxylase [Roseobacter cerasinus]|uniref:arginine decarboxylase n=1 Tax=Roseobacter cerasinus TaxID=2602289 RepID=A0A640VRQ0_9RHOB|nr:biosynthetic arginine decarboxylase [Roseobacter cerasinus]GFE51068.1 arginine decarboxylase [Roseobacter cerasinus]